MNVQNTRRNMRIMRRISKSCCQNFSNYCAEILELSFARRNQKLIICVGTAAKLDESRRDLSHEFRFWNFVSLFTSTLLYILKMVVQHYKKKICLFFSCSVILLPDVRISCEELQLCQECQHSRSSVRLPESAKLVKFFLGLNSNLSQTVFLATHRLESSDAKRIFYLAVLLRNCLLNWCLAGL
jgi:hypothetical protein